MKGREIRKRNDKTDKGKNSKILGAAATVLTAGLIWGCSSEVVAPRALNDTVQGDSVKQADAVSEAGETETQVSELHCGREEVVYTLFKINGKNHQFVEDGGTLETPAGDFTVEYQDDGSFVLNGSVGYTGETQEVYLKIDTDGSVTAWEHTTEGDIVFEKGQVEVLLEQMDLDTSGIAQYVDSTNYSGMFGGYIYGEPVIAAEGEEVFAELEDGKAWLTVHKILTPLNADGDEMAPVALVSLRVDDSDGVLEVEKYYLDGRDAIEDMDGNTALDATYVNESSTNDECVNKYAVLGLSNSVDNAPVDTFSVKKGDTYDLGYGYSVKVNLVVLGDPGMAEIELLKDGEVIKTVVLDGTKETRIELELGHDGARTQKGYLALWTTGSESAEQ